MDLYVERQCVDEMKKGETSKFMMLFDANFDDVYEYISRRVPDMGERERIVRTSFMDALGQIQNTPTDITYLVWLYTIAKPRVWDFIARESVPAQRGLIYGKKAGAKDSIEKAENMMKKLSLEEREILRLKLFEQVTDGDVMTILGLEEGAIGPKIYRVLKRAHFLLFGESDEKQGVYFGELSGFFERIRTAEEIEPAVALKLSLRNDLDKKISSREFAVEGEFEEEVETPFDVKDPVDDGPAPTGSNDPAKIFVEAVKEMREEEAQEAEKERVSFERREKMFDFIDKWKAIFALIPVVIFAFVVGIIFVNVFDFGGIERGYPNTCEIDVVFEGDFSDGEMRGVNKGISDRICDHFEVDRLVISRADEGVLNVSVDVPSWMLEYRFVQKIKDWRINKYERTPYSNEESGEVSGNNGGISRA
jgi:DNA-directed RNA polymerase specialized sigma24 family protein